MAVGGQVAKALSEALLDAYQPERLDQMLYYELGRDRVRITMAGDYETVVFRLIRTADSEGWLPELVAAARRQRADHAGLLAVAQRMGLAVDSSSLERNVRRWIPDFDPVAWRERLGVLERQVCRIERDTPTGAIACGTGFLVAPDLVLTNHHVVRELAPQLIRCRFDYRRDAGGRLVHEGTAVPLAGDWLVAHRPSSAADDLERTPAPHELDFALLRLASSRECVTLGGIDAVRPGDPLVILQHPEGKPVQLSFGEVLEINEDGTRLRHAVNTTGGSSGSPCFSIGLSLVALHQGGDPREGKARYNRAIPFVAIRAAVGGLLG